MVFHNHVKFILFPETDQSLLINQMQDPLCFNNKYWWRISNFW